MGDAHEIKLASASAERIALYQEALAILQSLAAQDRLSSEQKNWIDDIKGKLAETTVLQRVE